MLCGFLLPHALFLYDAREDGISQYKGARIVHGGGTILPTPNVAE